MCIPQLAPLFTAGAGGAAAAGAGAAATGAATGLQQLALAASVGGSLLSGVQANRAAKANAAALDAQADTERQLAAIEDERTRMEMRRQLRQQSADLVGAGVSLDSPTAVLLGDEAATELAFASQSARSTGQARTRTLSNQASSQRQRGRASLLSGTFSAAGDFFEQAPAIWPGLRGVA